MTETSKHSSKGIKNKETKPQSSNILLENQPILLDEQEDTEDSSEIVDDNYEDIDFEEIHDTPEDISLDGILIDPASQTISALAPFIQHVPERKRDSLQIYLKEISRFPMLTPEEELRLSREVKATGDASAAFRLISSHLRLVVRIAMDFQRKWLQNVLDLIQEGNVGLVRAVSKFDPEKGIKFSYYASFWIKAYILKFIMDNWRMVKIGTTQSQRKLFYNLNKERQALIAQGYNPDASTLAQKLNVSEDQIVEMEQRLDASDLSLDAPVSDEDARGATKIDFIPALEPGISEVLENKEIVHLVRERLESLTPKLSEKERYILANRVLSDEPATLREIGEKFDITRERVRQIEARLLQKIRDHLFANIQDFSKDWIEN